MNAMSVMPTAQSRLTRYYLDKLQRANDDLHRGPGNRDHWRRVIKQDWEQIRVRQALTASRKETDREQARLCMLFAVATSDILRIQLTPMEQLTWTQQALDGARLLTDHKAERILLYRSGYLSLTVEKLDLADRYAQQLVDLAQVAQDDVSLGRAWYLLGTVEFTRGAYDVAETYYTKSKAQFEACNANDEIPIVWRGLGRVSQFRGDYHQALTYHQRNLEASAAAGNDYEVLDAHVSLSGTLLSLDEYHEAERYAQQAVMMARGMERSRLFVPSLLSLAHAQKWLGKYERANAHYEEAIETARSYGSAPSTLSNGLYGLAQSKYLQGDYVAAAGHMQEALEIARAAQHVMRICEASHDLVYVHVALHEFDKARDRLEEAFQSAARIDTPHFLAKTLAAAIALWKGKGDFEQAAIWAGLLTKYTQLLHPSLFNMAVYEALENDLGKVHYRRALEQGKILTLEQVIQEIGDRLSNTVYSSAQEESPQRSS